LIFSFDKQDETLNEHHQHQQQHQTENRNVLEIPYQKNGREFSNQSKLKDFEMNFGDITSLRISPSGK
jgi:hypothetical protein